MIKNIEIQNFKSILKTSIPTGNLNLFTGINGSGKSTFLQSLLLLRQSYFSGGFYKQRNTLHLGGQNSFVNLGTFKDILCQQAPKGDERINFQIDFDNSKLKYISDSYNSENRDLNFLKGIIEKKNEFDNENLFVDNCQYLAAERIQPMEDYPRFQFNESLGIDGAYTAHYIEKYGGKDIEIKGLSLKKNPTSYTLINQINDWMGEISESIEVVTKENLNTNRIELSYIFKQSDGTPSQNQKPQNVGFGITHTLPIVVAILSATPGNLIIIENPESHLHPRGQSRLSQLIALAAENGVQLFIETHSDHIVNGLRVAVKKRKLSNKNIFVNYCTKDDSNISSIERIMIDDEGGLEKWPDNFFDEWDKLLNDLL